jgi:hypothetical protein
MLATVSEEDHSFMLNLFWPMGGKPKCHLGMLKVNKLKHSFLNVMKLENYGPRGGMFKVLHSSVGSLGLANKH